MSLPIYYESSFLTYQSHISGSQVQIATNNQGNLVSLGTDDVMCLYSNNLDLTEPQIFTVQNPHGFKITKLAIRPNNNNTVIIGTQEGIVHEYSLPQGTNHISPTLTHQHTIYRQTLWGSPSLFGVRSLQFTKDGRFLIIITNELACIIYDFQSKMFFKHKLQQQTQFLTVTTDYANKFLSLIDAQGKAHIFSIQIREVAQKMELEDQQDSEDPFACQNTPKTQATLKLLATYKIMNSNLNILRKHKFNILASFSSDDSSFMNQNLYLPGQNTLQKVTLSLPPAHFSSQYNLCTGIYHPTQIIQAIWLKNEKSGLILTGTELQAVIWHEKKEEKVMIFNLSTILGSQMKIRNICIRMTDQLNNWGFAFLGQSKNPQQVGEIKIYDFKAFNQLQKQLIKHEMGQMSINQANYQKSQKEFQIQKLEESNKAKPKKKKTQHQQSIASKLLTVYLRPSIIPGFQKYTGDNARFLFYNNIGCIIERQIANRQSFLELQFHDKSKISRIKISSDAFLQHFALCHDTLVTASLNKLNVQSQKLLKEGFSWDYEWFGIQGVAIGGDWICAVNKGEIKIWDWAGNQLHSIAFDRKFMAIAAYEDLLAIVYHSNLPMWGAQSYKMLIYQVTPYTIRCIKNTNVPSKPTVPLKWFGFSEQGMLFCQDQSEILRCYLFQKDEWVQLMTIDPLIERIFIQHVQNYELYGFRLQQKFPNQPRVIPRSLPRKIPFQLNVFNVSFLTPQQSNYINRHKLSILWLQHEKYRHNRWSKIKYSRRKENRWYERSNTIKGEQEIRQNQGRLDLKLMEYVQKYIKLHKNDSKIQGKHWKALMTLCLELAFYEETKNRMTESLMQAQIQHNLNKDISMFICQQQCSNFLPQKKTKINQLNRLQEMMGLQWFVDVPDYSELKQYQ